MHVQIEYNAPNKQYNNALLNTIIIAATGCAPSLFMRASVRVYFDYDGLLENVIYILFIVVKRITTASLAAIKYWPIKQH